MRAATLKGYATATDLADYLVKKGLPFRDAHAAVGKLVALGLSKNIDLAEIDLIELQTASALIENDVYDILSLDGSLSSRNHFGGTAPSQVKQAIKRARMRIN